MTLIRTVAMGSRGSAWTHWQGNTRRPLDSVVVRPKAEIKAGSKPRRLQVGRGMEGKASSADKRLMPACQPIGSPREGDRDMARFA